MTTNKKIVWVALVCVVVAAGIYAYAYWKVQTGAPESNPSLSDPAMGKLTPSSTEDGTYTVIVHSIMTTPTDTAITFSHITYFEGVEATASARKEVDCGTQPIESCVPTLAYGFYVRPSGSPDFTAPVTAQTTIVLKDKPAATMRDLQNLRRGFEPAFDVVITDGNIVSITERTPIVPTKG